MLRGSVKTVLRRVFDSTFLFSLVKAREIILKVNKLLVRLQSNLVYFEPQIGTTNNVYRRREQILSLIGPKYTKPVPGREG